MQRPRALLYCQVSDLHKISYKIYVLHGLLRVQNAAGLSLPLSERPVEAEVSEQDLFLWHSKAKTQAKAVGTAFEDADGGPSPEDLLVLCSLSCLM